MNSKDIEAEGWKGYCKNAPLTADVSDVSYSWKVIGSLTWIIAPLRAFMGFNACPMRPKDVPCKARATQLPAPTTTRGRLRHQASPLFVRCSTNSSSVNNNCSIKVIIRESPEVAADHDSHVAERVVLLMAAVVIGSPLAPSRAIPKKLPLVAKPWLAEMETETVMAAVNDTSCR